MCQTYDVAERIVADVLQTRERQISQYYDVTIRSGAGAIMAQN
jgi:hypothetical protein